MQRYQSHKVVEAAKIMEFDPGPDQYNLFLEGSGEYSLASDVGVRIVTMMADATARDGAGNDLGWLVVYPDGYISWSPSSTFEEGYDLVQPSSGKSKIAGYRELSETEIFNMNAVKEHGRTLGDLYEILMEMDETDKRWVAEGRTDLQKGLMCWTRAIAKPEFF